MAATPRSVKTSSGPTGVGTTYRQISKVFGRKIEMNNEVTVFEPPHVFEWRGISGPTHMVMRFTLTAEGQGTSVLQSGDGETGGIFKLADPIVARTMKKQFEADLENLKTLVESGIAEAPLV
ncbi:MAG: hypothetical protein NVS2B16_28660 [Chloroflexota bacterium]